MPGTLTIEGLAAGLPSGQQAYGPLTDTGTTAIGEAIPTYLAIGDNTFTVPTGAVRVALFIPAGGIAATLKVRTNLNGADGGLPVGPYSGTPWVSFPLATGVTSVTLNSSAVLTNIIAIVFI